MILHIGTIFIEGLCCVKKVGANAAFSRSVVDSVEIFSAILGTTQAKNFLVFDGKLIVIGDFFAIGNGLLGVNHNLLLPIDGDNFCITIRL